VGVLPLDTLTVLAVSPLLRELILASTQSPQGLSPAGWWLQPVVYTVLGLALVVGGLVIGRRERATT
jgi:hypothetical protein